MYETDNNEHTQPHILFLLHIIIIKNNKDNEKKTAELCNLAVYDYAEDNEPVVIHG